MHRKIVFANAPGTTVITDPEILASLRLSPDAIAKIEQLERATAGPRGRVLLDRSSGQPIAARRYDGLSRHRPS